MRTCQPIQELYFQVIFKNEHFVYAMDKFIIRVDNGKITSHKSQIPHPYLRSRMLLE